MVLWFQVTKHIFNAVWHQLLCWIAHRFLVCSLCPLHANLHVSGGVYAAHQCSCNVSRWAGLTAAHPKRIHALWLEGGTSGKRNACKRTCFLNMISCSYSSDIFKSILLTRCRFVQANNFKLRRVRTFFFFWVVYKEKDSDYFYINTKHVYLSQSNVDVD